MSPTFADGQRVWIHNPRDQSDGYRPAWLGIEIGSKGTLLWTTFNEEAQSYDPNYVEMVGVKFDGAGGVVCCASDLHPLDDLENHAISA